MILSLFIFLFLCISNEVCEDNLNKIAQHVMMTAITVGLSTSVSMVFMSISSVVAVITIL